jgi:pilus assembly protein CpaC
MKRVRGLCSVLACLAAAGAQTGTQTGTQPVSGAEELKLAVGRSVVLDYPADIARISTSNPEVVDAVAVSLREVLLNAKSQGLATVVIWPKTGRRSLYLVTVEQNLEPMQQLLRETFPGQDIRVQAARDSVSLTGRVTSKEAAERAAALVAPLAKSVVSNLEIAAAPPEKQIVLRVRFAELNRAAGRSFAVNLLSSGMLNTQGTISTGQASSTVFPQPFTYSIPGRNEGATTKFTISDALNVFAFRPDLNLGAFIRALQSQNLLQILAEPNLVTTNGKEASFLVGGEFPVPIVQGGANVGAVTIMFKEFGIRLNFLPVVTGHGTIRMHVRPEVSTIDLANAVTLSGFTIPALASRRMETDVELGEGQSFLIGGLLDERVTETLFKIPGLSNIPILGVLFKSRQENKTSTELIVLVTPEIGVPIARSAAQPMPAMPKDFLTPVTPERAPSGRDQPARPSGRKEKGK